MTQYAPENLYSVLTSLSPALKSIEIKTLAVLNPLEQNFQNLVTSIIFSDRTIEEIKEEQKQIPDIKNGPIKFYCDAIPFNIKFLDKIAGDEICYPFGRSIQFQIKTRPFNFYTLKLFSTRQWFNDKVFNILKAQAIGVEADRKPLWDVVINENVLAKRCGFSSNIEMIKECLHIDYNHPERKDFEIWIISPVKIKKTKIVSDEIQVDLHNPSKLDNLQINSVVKRNYNIIWRKTCEVDPEKNLLEFKIKEILPYDSIEFELIHRDSCLTLDSDYIKVPLKNVVEPFIKTLDAFCSIEKHLKPSLFEPQKEKKPQDVFEDAVCWLLSLAGFNVIRLKLGKKSFDRLLHNGEYHIGSADIIAYEDNDRLLLIDCDINSVDQKKVKKLAELKKHFREQLKGFEKMHITPILFTPTDYSSSSMSDVKIADKEIIEKIFSDVIKGNRQRARSHLYHYSL